MYKHIKLHTHLCTLHTGHQTVAEHNPERLPATFSGTGDWPSWMKASDNL